jgi:dolichol-phosphate mannosyltransferase
MAAMTDSSAPARVSMPATFVVIPTYNEASNLPRLTSELFALPVTNLHVVIVDDNSPDRTGEVAERLRQTYPRHLHVIHRPEKTGLGSAYRDGFAYSLDHGAERIVQMDADFSHSPGYIPEFLHHIGEYDVVVGSRYVPGGKLDEQWSWWRHLLSWWANSVYTRLILQLPVRDATAGFKCWNRACLSSVLAYPVHSNGYIFQVEMAYLAHKLGYRALEIPIYFEDRRIGRSKMSNSIKFEATWRTWDLRWRYRHVHPVSPSPGESLTASANSAAASLSGGMLDQP